MTEWYQSHLSSVIHTYIPTYLPTYQVVAKNLAEEGTKNSRGRYVHTYLPTVAHSKALTELHHPTYLPTYSAPAVIILAPTRELAKQCDEQLSRIGRPLGLWIRTIYGRLVGR